MPSKQFDVQHLVIGGQTLFVAFCLKEVSRECCGMREGTLARLTRVHSGSSSRSVTKMLSTNAADFSIPARILSIAFWKIAGAKLTSKGRRFVLEVHVRLMSRHH